MARLHSALGDRLLYNVATGLIKAQGTTSTIYKDPAATVKANLAYYDPTNVDQPGSPIVGAVLATDAYSLRPGFWDLDDLDVLYMVAGSGGPAEPIHPDPQSQISALQAAVDDLGDTPPNAHAATHVLGGTDPITVNQSQVIGLPAALIAAGARKPVYYLDVYNNFFGGASNVWAVGQGITPTTLSAQATAGTATLSVTSPTGLVVGTVLATGIGTPTQKLYRVTAVAGSDLTVTPNVVTTLTNGATVAPLWTNATHLTADPYGSKAFGYFISEAKDSTGAYIFNGANKKVVWLGDSWTAPAVPGLSAALNARLGATTVIDSGFPGYALGDLIPKFATDVAPYAPDYVIVEFGVNDVNTAVDPVTLAGYVDQIVLLCQSINAIAVITGMVPLQAFPVQTAQRQLELKGQISTPAMPSTTMSAILSRTGKVGVSTAAPSNLRIGADTQMATADGNNLAIGKEVQKALTAGTANVGIGVKAQTAATTATNNIGIGVLTQTTLNTGIANVGIGSSVQQLVTTGALNTAIGYRAQYAPNGDIANASTNPTGQTSVGAESGCANTNQAGYITTIGYRAIAAGSYATSLGAGTSAVGSGSAAIGTDSGGAGASTTTVNEIALGTANHTVKIAGKLNTAASVAGKAGLNVAPGTAPTSPVDGDIWTTAAGLFVRIAGATVGPLT